MAEQIFLQIVICFLMLIHELIYKGSNLLATDMLQITGFS